MSDDPLSLCQQLRNEATEAVRLAATINEKTARGAILSLARDLTALAVELETTTTRVVSKDLTSSER